MPAHVANDSKKGTLAAPDRILVATDLTDMGYLLPHCVGQAKISGAHVTLLHVIIPSDSLPVETDLVSYLDEGALDRDVRLTLTGAARHIEARGVPCDISVRHGFVAQVIQDELRLTGAIRLILGTHGRGKLGQLVLGSIAHQLLTKVDIPVFVVGPRARDGVEHATPRKILHPVSLMGDYQESVCLALNIAQAYSAELTLLHVLDHSVKDNVNPERSLEWARHALEALIPRATDLVPRIHTSVTSGNLAEKILKAAKHTDADWIVLGADGGFRFWSFNESAAYKVLTEANCPVLTLRHEPYRTRAVNPGEVHLTSPL